MNELEPELDAYRRQLAQWAQAMAVGRNEDVDGLAEFITVEHVKLFTDGNLDKRFEKIRTQAGLLEDAFENLDAMVDDYIHSVPSGAYDAGTSDCDRFLVWLGETCKPTLEQRDYIACQQARHAVESAARTNRRGYVRFHELRSLAEQLAGELDTNPALQVHLNPTRIWTTFQTRALLDDLSEIPADVLVYADGGEIRTAVLEDAGREMVRTLEQAGPSTIKEWAAAAECDRDEARELAIDLADLGLIAFA